MTFRKFHVAVEVSPVNKGYLFKEIKGITANVAGPLFSVPC